MLALENKDASMLKRSLAHYTAFLDRQRAAAASGAAAAGAAEQGVHSAASAAVTVSGARLDEPAVGAFSHQLAVNSWMQLISAIIQHGLWYLVQVWARREGREGLPISWILHPTGACAWH